jgi:TPR repeat protein
MPIFLPFFQLSQHMLPKHTRHYGSRHWLARLLTFNPTLSARGKGRLEMLIMRRIVSKHLACLQAIKDGMRQYASAQCFAAVWSFNFAISLGDESSRATFAWILIAGCEGVPKDFVRARQLAQIGADKGCPDCMGVLAFYYTFIGSELSHARFIKDFAMMALILNGLEFSTEMTYQELGHHQSLFLEKALALASQSAAKNSKYGLYVLGMLTEQGKNPSEKTNGGELIRWAAIKGLDAAQYEMGCKCFQTRYVKQDYAGALRYFHLAAAQGHLHAMVKIYLAHNYGRGIPKNSTEAERWRKRAQEGGAVSWY